MKKLLSMLLCMAMLLGMLPAAYLTVSAETAQTPITIAASNPGTSYVWFNHNSFVNNDTKTLEIADEGADDVGSVHVYQPDGQTADADMIMGIRVDCIPTGTYTIQYKIKGTDLGNTDNNSNKFYLYGNDTLTNQFRVAAGAKTLSDWTTVTETFTTTSDVYYIYLMVSKYVNGADYYVDNVKLLDSDGNDLLSGAGNFCTAAESGTEQTGSLLTLDTANISDAYELTEKKWTVMYPTGEPDTGTWAAWDSSTHYGEIVASGNQDAGALHLKSYYHKNAGVAFGAGMTVGESYTLGLWAKGTSDSGRVLALYANGDPAIIEASSELSADWSYYEITLTATHSQLNILASDWGVTDIYIDNITLTGSDGVDLLSGYGDFCTDTASDGTQLSQIYDSDPGKNYQWFNGNGYTATDDMYIEIVEDGADDAGAVHIYQTDGVVAAEDMRVHLKTDGIGVGTYTLQYNIKGSDLGITTTNDACRFYLNEESDLTTQFRNLAGAKTVSDWTTLSETITTTAESAYFILGISKYVSGIDCYVDNVKLLDADGNDLLRGAGNFCIAKTQEPEDGETSEPVDPPEIGDIIPSTFHSSEPEEFYQWYNGTGYAATDDMYIEIVADGADDVGSIHVYQTDGKTGTDDMRVNLRTEEIPAGTYTLQYNIKGTDLGNTDTANANKFYVSGNADPFLQFRNAAGEKTLTDWTQCSYEVTTTANASMFVLKVSKYVNGADYYVDNVKLLDSNGNDVLCGAGNFCTVYEGEPEPLEGVMTLDASAAASAYEAPKNVWTPMYPSGSPDSGTWEAWNDTHYGEIADIGYRDRGSLHLRSVSYKNVGVAIGLDMVVGESYTLGLWAKGNTNSGKVLALYANGNLAIIGSSTALTSDWSYYECTFTATHTQLNIVATDWGNTNIYLDNITLTDKNGADLLDGYGDFCTEEYRIAASVSLLDFNDTAESDLISVSGQTSVEGASDPTLTLNAEEAETGNAMQATWSYDGTNPSYLHRYAADQDSWVATFNEKAHDYRYLRMWVSNPGHVSVDVAVLLKGEDTVNYFDASAIKLIRKDGTEVYGSVNNNSGYGDNSCISVPKQFMGWLSIPLEVAGLVAADGYSTVISDFANVTDIELEFRKIATTGEGDSSEYYYVIDDICLGLDITGKTQSTQDSNSYADYDTSVKGAGQVKNVIFMIGDGMGYGALDVARLDRPTLYMDTIESLGGVVGEVQTTNLYGDITDSAAAGTALATGYLTKNTVLGLTENLEPVMNLGEYMKQLGKKLGLVTTTYVLDATPAAFAAHTSARGNFTSIALDILSLGVDVVQGGGRSYMTANVMDEDGNAVTLTELAQSQYGYSYATTADEMEAVTSGKLWGLYQDDNMSYVKENSATDPTLAEMTAKTFQLLENEDGFFAMIEGSQIDLAGHANSEIDTRLETLAFDDAIKVAMDYVDANPGTLLIITADHETGGISVAQDGTVSYSSTSHTDELVPYYAYGTGAECFENLTVNTEINYAIRQATIGDVSVGATSVATEAQLTDTEVMTATAQDGIITYTGIAQPAEITLTDADAAYAVVKYKTDETNLVGTMDEAKIRYAGDGKWHISDILVLSDSDTHVFQPMSYIKGEVYNSIDIGGKSVQIDYVGLFATYEQAAAFQAHAALTGATPTALNSLSMSLGDDLDMNFYVAADETNLANTTVSLSVGGETFSYTPTVPDASGEYKFSVELAAAQMTDTVTFRLKIGEAVIETGTYTVRQYADAILSGDYGDATKTLVREMLNYGGAAQSYFGYNTDNLAGSGITGAGEQQIPAQAPQAMTVQDQADGLDFYGASMVFRSKLAVRFYLVGDVTGCSFTANGQALTPVQKNGIYYVEIADIAPQALDEQITLTVTDANGSTLSVSYSPINYIVRMNAKGSDALKALLKAMYNYHLAAQSIAQ